MRPRMRRYTALIQLLLKKKLMGDELLLSRLENDVLQDVGLVRDAADFHKRQVKMNTRQLYTQQKYNLFREETEGYSKLIAELSELPASTDYTSTRGCKWAYRPGTLREPERRMLSMLLTYILKESKN